MSKREVPNLNRGNFPTWKSLMKLHLGGLWDHAQSTITTEHVDPTGVLIVEDLKKKKEHNQAMLEISFSLSYEEFDYIKGCDSAKKMWDALHTIYGGEKIFYEPKLKVLEVSLMIWECKKVRVLLNISLG